MWVSKRRHFVKIKAVYKSIVCNWLIKTLDPKPTSSARGAPCQSTIEAFGKELRLRKYLQLAKDRIQIQFRRLLLCSEKNNIQCPSKTCADCKKFQNKESLKDACVKVVYRPTAGRIEDINRIPGILESETETLNDVLLGVRKSEHTEIKDAGLMSQPEYQISCRRCRTTVEHARNVSNIDSNNSMGICDHCRTQENLRQKFLGKHTKQIAIEHNKNLESKKRVKIWLSKIQRLIKNIDDNETESNFKNRVDSCLDFDKLHRNSPKHEPLVEELLFHRDSDFNKKSNKDFEPKKNKIAAVALPLPDAICNDSLPGATYEFRTQRDSQFRDHDRLLESLELDFEGDYEQTSGIIEYYAKSYNQAAETPVAEGFSDHLTLRNGKKENLRKDLQIESQGYRRKYCSQETLFTNFSRVRADSLDKDFMYLFPQVVVDNISTRHETHESLSELISDAKAAQLKAQEKKRERDEKLLRKRDRHEKGKSNKIKNIRHDMTPSTHNLISEEVKKQETDGPENQEIQTESVTNIKQITARKTQKNNYQKKDDQRPERGKYEKKPIKPEEVENSDIVEGKMKKKDNEKKNRGQPDQPAKVNNSVIAEGRVNKKDDDQKKSKAHPDKPAKVENACVADEVVTKKDNDKKNKAPLNDENTLADGKTESFSKGKKKVIQSTTSALTMKRITVINTDPDDFLLNLVKLHKSKPKNLEQPVRLEHASEIKKYHKDYKRDIKFSFLSKEEMDDSSITMVKDVKKYSDVIKGEKIHKYTSCLPEKNIEAKELPPILFKSAFQDETLHENILVSESERQLVKSEKTPLEQDSTKKGIIRYSLSDPTFIDKGWTLLPTQKVVRKMNVYRMRPAHPEYDWFKHNKSKRLMHYETGEKLAEFDENGRGRWYYRNGRLALDYYDAEELNAQQRFVIYSSGESDERGCSRPITVLATFDFLGNGIVFDHAGKIRLKYNQTEGVILDRSIGPVSHWKWHALNDPPVLQQVMIESQLAHKDPVILSLGSPLDNKPRQENEEMLNIEFDNFVKEKNRKLSQKFKPFQIKMKSLKINEQFSLRVLDQANIYLKFRDGSTNIKLNMGMLLDPHEIIDTDTAEVSEVSNGFDRLPARTNSIAALQEEVRRAQRIEKFRVERLRRHRPTLPEASADRLIAGASRPLRLDLLRSATSSSIVAHNSRCYCKCRKPNDNSLRYDIRLV